MRKNRNEEENKKRDEKLEFGMSNRVNNVRKNLKESTNKADKGETKEDKNE